MNIIIPMGGKGQRFIDAGYTVPKPFIDVLGTPMYQLAINNLSADNTFDQFVFIISKDHKDYLYDILTFTPRAKIVIIEQKLAANLKEIFQVCKDHKEIL
jgi:NDP-sugar pyrophosphorylase family protein